MPVFLTAADVAARLSLSRQTVYNLRKAGHLPAIDVSIGNRPQWRFPLAAVLAYEGTPRPQLRPDGRAILRILPDVA